MKFIISQNAAIDHLKKIFLNSPSDTITPEEAYVASGRDLTDKAGNKLWIRNEISKLRQHGLITTRLGKKNKRQQITHIELTEQGRIALNRAEGKLSTSVTKNGKSQETNIAQLITKLTQDNPNRKIVYNIGEGTISLQQ